MVIEEMTERECRAILERARLARLACALNNQPYIVPVHVDFYNSYLYGFATLGQKIEWMRQNPLVCVEVDELSTAHQWATVVVFGRYEELPDGSEYEYERRVAEQLFQRHPVWWEPASVPLAGHRPRPLIVFRIVIDRTTGRRAGPERDAPMPLGDSPERERRRRLAKILRRVLGRH
jgi:nitroimidazol reductase NimA-like FMN-containing flavoprotein (pyridoxamine 5'-phosphate oxidase superfamily)